MKLQTVICCAVMLVAMLTRVSAASDVTCKDPSGKTVDWYVAYKLPRIHKIDPQTENGLKFYYLDANTPVWHVSPKPINETNQPIADTINQVYGKTDILHLMYNDEKPDGEKSFSRGHTKGVIAFGPGSGFWLVHSVPKFPPPDKYDYPETGQHYGQSFLCLTLGTQQNLDKIVDQLLINYPYLYGTNVPQSMTSQKLEDLLKGHRNRTDQASVVELKTVKGVSFYSFAKNEKWGKDLYSGLVAPWVKSSVLVETWMNGKNPMPSDCSSQYKVRNVRHVSFGASQEFKETEDHSKWAVANTQPWTCVGDINRMESQKERCGGTVCFNNTEVNKSFLKIITDADQCRTFAPETHEMKLDKL